VVGDGVERVYLGVDVVVGCKRRRRRWQSEVVEVVEVETDLGVIREDNDRYLTVHAVHVDSVDQLTREVQHSLVVLFSDDAGSSDQDSHVRANTTRCHKVNIMTVINQSPYHNMTR